MRKETFDRITAIIFARVFNTSIASPQAKTVSGVVSDEAGNTSIIS